MAQAIEQLQTRLQQAVAPGFRERLLDKGLSRGLIWREGALPEDAPPFPISLTEDLLDYAYAVMAMALHLRTASPGAQPLERAFLVAGEAIEAAVHRVHLKVEIRDDEIDATVAVVVGGINAHARASGAVAGERNAGSEAHLR